MYSLVRIFPTQTAIKKHKKTSLKKATTTWLLSKSKLKGDEKNQIAGKKNLSYCRIKTCLLKMDLLVEYYFPVLKYHAASLIFQG